MHKWSKIMATIQRAAYWTDGQSDVCLTTAEEQHLSDEKLIARAHEVAEEIGLEIGDGEILIGSYDF